MRRKYLFTNQPLVKTNGCTNIVTNWNVIRMLWNTAVILVWVYSTGHFIMDFIFFYKKSRLNPFVHLSNIFFQNTDTEVRLEHWETLSSAIIRSRAGNSISEWLKGPTWSLEFFFCFFFFVFVYEGMFPKLWKVV